MAKMPLFFPFTAAWAHGCVSGFCFGIGLIVAAFVMKFIFHIGFCGG